MSLMSGGYFKRLGLAGAFVIVLAASAQAREAAFIDPGLSGGNANDGALKVEPKDNIDTGETVLNVAKRTTLFFVNQTNQPVKVEKLSVNGDGNVNAEVTNDDCSKQETIAPLSRCSVEISVTPTSPGPWGVDALLTHNGAGRIAQAKLTGKTSGSTAANEKKETGLALSTKEVSPVNFGDVDAGTGKAVRSALMVNDSPEPITLYSIDVIEADNGLQRLEQGCAVDMELKPGESCPVTLLWTPTDPGQISTDLIIRHSGRLGFAVIPIRGNAKGVLAGKGKDNGKDSGKMTITLDGKGSVPPPPSAQDLEKAMPVAPVAASSLGTNTAVSAASSSGILRLIGTVGNRGVFLTPDGNTAVSGVGEDFDSEGSKVKVLSISSKAAVVLANGKKKDLRLGMAPELVTKGMSQKSSDASATSGASSVPTGSSSMNIPSSGSASGAASATAPIVPQSASSVTSGSGLPK